VVANVIHDSMLQRCCPQSHGLKGSLDKEQHRASRIVIGLKSALDFEQGGELSRNLDELYDYVIRKILHVNIHNDVSALLEIHGLMSEIQQAWKSMPGLISARVPVQSSAFTGSAAVH
jgi:flagellar protein FliS